MIIETMITGAYGRKTVYAVCNDATETGDKPHEIARFDALDAATAVMKYWRGDTLSESDEYMAREAIRKAGAPTGQSRRDRKAD